MIYTRPSSSSIAPYKCARTIAACSGAEATPCCPSLSLAARLQLLDTLSYCHLACSVHAHQVLLHHLHRHSREKLLAQARRTQRRNRGPPAARSAATPTTPVAATDARHARHARHRARHRARLTRYARRIRHPPRPPPPPPAPRPPHSPTRPLQSKCRTDLWSRKKQNASQVSEPSCILGSQPRKNQDGSQPHNGSVESKLNQNVNSLRNPAAILTVNSSRVASNRLPPPYGRDAAPAGARRPPAPRRARAPPAPGPRVVEL